MIYYYILIFEVHYSYLIAYTCFYFVFYKIKYNIDLNIIFGTVYLTKSYFKTQGHVINIDIGMSNN